MENKSVLDCGKELSNSLLDFCRILITSDDINDLELVNACLSIYLSMVSDYGFPKK